MRLAIIALCLMALSACTIKKDEFRFMRMDTAEHHASLEREDFGGLVIETISETGAPKIIVGKVNHTQAFLPKLECTTFYREDGTMERTECQQITPVSFEARLDAEGAYAGDIIQTGDAVEYSSAYGEGGHLLTAWIESIKGAVEQSEMDRDMKIHWADTLSRLAEMLGGAK